MRLIQKIVLIINVMVFTFFVTISIQKNIVNAEEKKYETEYAIYEETEVVTNQMLGYGINHINTKAITTAKRCTNTNSSLIVDSPQNVNILSVPSAKNIRVINYTYLDDDGWSKQTLSKMVENFELNNPGWTVIAGVNGDFYDINGNDKALPYHTTGTTVTNTDVLRAVESKSIGYFNDGTTASFIIVDEASFTNHHILTIYDENDDVIATYNVDKINESPSNDELAIYYTYRVNKDTDGDNIVDNYDEIKMTVPSQNSYIIKSPLRCLPTSEPEIFAKGDISHINEEMKLNFGEFAIVTANADIKTKLSIGTTVRVQKNLTGELEDCDQVMGVGSTLIENGVVSENNSDGMRTDRHPRTCVGVKEDGTLMFFVIDGRQLDNNMYGMTQDEMGAMMAYYDCYQGVNIDGGGSSTFGIRNENGEFVIVNSPSDGHERLNANSLLIVVPELNIKTSDYTDTSVKLSFGEISKGIKIENIKVSINNVEKMMTSNEMIFDGLTNDTLYELTYNYDVTYEGIKTNVTSKKQTFKTGKVPPKVEKSIFDIINDNVVINYKITDVNNLASMMILNYKNGITFLEQFENSKLEIPSSSFTNFDMFIEINYKVESIPNYSTRKKTSVTWYPANFDITIYDQTDQNEIINIIKGVNEKIVIETKEQMILSIEEARTKILSYKTASEKEELTKILELEKAQIDSILKLEQVLVNKNFNDKNQKKAEEILTKAINDINASKDVNEINEILNKATSDINNLKEKGCKKNSTIIVLYSLSLFSLGCYMILKKQ